MATKPIAERSTEELLKTKKTLSAVLGVVASVGILLIGTYTWLIVSGSSTSLMPVGIGGLVALTGGSMPAATQYSQIRKELAKRSAS